MRTLYDMVHEGYSWSGRERNVCFLNTGQARFADVSTPSGFDFPDDGRGTAVCDWDQDGDLDLWVSNFSGPQLRFLRNDFPLAAAHFLALRLEGQSCNRDAIGARVELLLADESPPLVRSLEAGDAFVSQSSKWLHFGLGKRDGVRAARVHWPGGQAETFTGLAADGRFTLVQGSGRADRWTPRTTPQPLAPKTLDAIDSTPTAQVFLAYRLPMPALPYLRLDGQPATFAGGSGRPALVLFWSATCRPCLAELAELGQRAEAVRAAGLEVLALHVDGCSGPATAGEELQAALDRVGFSFPAGRAESAAGDKIRTLHEELFTDGQLPLPVSFLVSAEGEAAAVYKGKVGLDRVLADLSAISADPVTRRDRSIPFPGRWHAPPAPPELEKLANRLYRQGFAEDAVVAFRAALQRQPGRAELRLLFGQALVAVGRQEEGLAICREATAELSGQPGSEDVLARVLLAVGRTEEAVAAFRRVARAFPDDPGAHDSLAGALLQAGQVVAAVAEYREALRVGGEHPDSLANLALALLETGKPIEAEARLRRALELDPRHVAAHLHLGLVYFRQQRFGDAVAALTQLLTIDPEHRAGRDNLALAYVQQGRWADAEREYRLVLAAAPRDPAAHNRLARVLAEQGRFREAAAALEQVLALDPNFPSAQSNLEAIRREVK